MIKVSPALLEAHVRAFVGLMDGGDVLLCAGPRPADPSAPAKAVVAAIPVKAGDFAVSGSSARLGSVEGRVRQDGRVAWFRFAAPDRTGLLDGDVSVAGQEGDMRLTRLDLMAGDRVTIEGFDVGFVDA